MPFDSPPIVKYSTQPFKKRLLFFSVVRFKILYIANDNAARRTNPAACANCIFVKLTANVCATHTAGRTEQDEGRETRKLMWLPYSLWCVSHDHRLPLSTDKCGSLSLSFGLSKSDLYMLWWMWVTLFREGWRRRRRVKCGWGWRVRKCACWNVDGRWTGLSVVLRLMLFHTALDLDSRDGNAIFKHFRKQKPFLRGVRRKRYF